MLTLSQRWFLAAAACLSFGGGACGGDETVPLEPVTYELSVTHFNGVKGNVATPHCDGTLAVTVEISPADSFSLRPLHACGTSPRCGYVHVELLQGGQVVSAADSVTLEPVLRVPNVTDVTQLEGTQLQVSLRSGIDEKTIVNADTNEAAVTVEPKFELPTDCVDSGIGGAGGAGGAGSGGEPSEPVAGAGGAGGAADGGAGGQAGEAQGGQGGAAGGEAPIAGAGGA